VGLIFLCGLPGCGKSTVGALLAQKLGVDFIDLDQSIAARRDMSIAEIFEHEGEAVYRDDEQQELASAINKTSAVIALGGGIFERSENLEMVVGAGKLIYLETEPDVILDRKIDWSLRPLMKGSDVSEKLTQLHVRREAAYKRAHQMVLVSVNRTASDVADMILKALKS
jgi:shikimate kinase